MKRTYSVEELGEIAEGLLSLLGAIEDGSLAVDAGTISRLEGAASAVQALPDGQNPSPDDE